MVNRISSRTSPSSRLPRATHAKPGPTHEGTNREARAVECFAYGATCVKCGQQDHIAKACKSGKPEKNKVSAIHYNKAEKTTRKLSQQNQPGDPQSSHRSSSRAQPQVATTISNMTVQFPMPHFEFDPYLANWEQTTPRPPSTLQVALQLHEKTYTHLNAQKPTDHPPCRPQDGQATTPPKINTGCRHKDPDGHHKPNHPSAHRICFQPHQGPNRGRPKLPQNRCCHFKHP